MTQCHSLSTWKVYTVNKGAVIDAVDMQSYKCSHINLLSTNNRTFTKSRWKIKVTLMKLQFYTCVDYWRALHTLPLDKHISQGQVINRLRTYCGTFHHIFLCQINTNLHTQYVDKLNTALMLSSRISTCGARQKLFGNNISTIFNNI